MADLIVSTLTQGLIFALLSYGVYIPIRCWTSRTSPWTAAFPWGRR